MQQPAVSVIVPAFNAEARLERSVRSVLGQTLEARDIEIIIVDDGSTDATGSIAAKLAREHSSIQVVTKNNGGVSSARNAGIERASGRYLAFLDSDDEMEPATLAGAVRLFDAHYEDTDVVTYPMILFNERRQWPHAREEILTSEGVYDLRNIDNCFALVNTVNVLVKNDANLPRFDERMTLHEDERFLLTILLRKLTVGFSTAGGYRYEQRPGSTTYTKVHPFYQFEPVMAFWEEMFAPYASSDAPLYLQACFLNELNWKTKQDLVFPYHYDERRYAEAIERIRSLMDYVCPEVISHAPRMTRHLRRYYASLRHQPLELAVNSSGCVIAAGGEPVCVEDAADLRIRRTRFVTDEEGKEFFRVEGVLQSVAFSYDVNVDVSVTVTDMARNREETQLDVHLSSSSMSRASSHILTARFFNIVFDIPCNRAARATMRLSIDGCAYPLEVTASDRAHFSTANSILTTTHGRNVVTLIPTCAEIHVSRSATPAGAWLRTTATDLSLVRTHWGAARYRLVARHAHLGARIWLYHDRGAVGKDNAYYQFLHDIEQDDGIDRYYVTDAPDATLAQMFDDRSRKRVVRLGSRQHKILYLRAEKILVAYIEKPNWMPFSDYSDAFVCDVTNYELVYLQHGVLHAHTPWKYSADRLLPDYEVVSTSFEIDNLTTNYGFAREQLIDSGMARFDFMQADVARLHGSRILFAPSWRNYLVAPRPGLMYAAKSEAFEASTFWRETKQLLTSHRLAHWLERHDTILDIKLHPIFSVYRSRFEEYETERIRVVDDADRNDYRLVLTDYSSVVFDFVYAGAQIVYFVPDYPEFRSGLNGYHELDLPLEEGFGPLTTSAAQLLDILEADVESAEYAKRRDGFFLHKDTQCRARLYRCLIGEQA